MKPTLLLGVAAVAAALSVAAPFVVYPVLLMQALCLALFASAFNLLLGFGGLLSFGHAAFLSAAAYVTALAVRDFGVPAPLGVLLGTAAAALLGLAMGAVAIRRQGIYFSMITLALAQMVYFFFVQSPWTGAEDGMQGVPRGTLFGLVDLNDNLAMYFFVLAVCAAAFALIVRTVHSPFGDVLKAIRENEPRAVSLGYDVARHKLLAFVLSAALAGLAGALKALVMQLASLNDAHWHTSGDAILMTLLGGLGTLAGPVVGAFMLTGLHHLLSGMGSWLLVLSGLVFMVTVMVFRRGVVGQIGHLWRRRATARAAEAPAAPAAPARPLHTT
ncbi:branched-chain amino acid ABC transporter permease [Variovorax sp. JS1663]|uniref:branched-chain amino acid ABC transporter permease n=1 Tax=Variovorax sp. JS1663 TaxID=1851577 RepID=UPI000B3444D5|nr:branched-chain amino acid ABC transporter permease [Variovorax sp. JS1663]OUL99606.1 ABC transporter permease [Variovorax sp. JS1663]